MLHNAAVCATLVQDSIPEKPAFELKICENSDNLTKTLVAVDK